MQEFLYMIIFKVLFILFLIAVVHLMYMNFHNT